MPKEVKWAISLLVGGLLLLVGWKFYMVLVTLHVLICALLIAVVLLQSGKAADLAGAFGGAGSQTAFGPRGAATFLSQATTWCAVMFMLTSMALTVHQNTTASAIGGGSVLQQFSQPGTPAAPGATPAPATTPVPAAPGPESSAPALPAPAAPAPATPAPTN